MSMCVLYVCSMIQFSKGMNSELDPSTHFSDATPKHWIPWGLSGPVSPLWTSVTSGLWHLSHTVVILTPASVTAFPKSYLFPFHSHCIVFRFNLLNPICYKHSQQSYLPLPSLALFRVNSLCPLEPECNFEIHIDHGSEPLKIPFFNRTHRI